MIFLLFARSCGFKYKFLYLQYKVERASDSSVFALWCEFRFLCDLLLECFVIVFSFILLVIDLLYICINSYIIIIILYNNYIFVIIF